MFRKAYGLPAGEHRDKPDVVVPVGSKTIGIEITNSYISDGSSPSSEQVQRKRRESAVELAQRLYTKSSGAENIQLSVGFDKEHPIHDCSRVAEELSRVAEEL